MAKKPHKSGETKTRRAIVQMLKRQGPTDSASLAERLDLTAMAVRQHLYALQEEKLVTADERPVPIGRPAKFWKLTRDADRLFPEAYAELSVAIIDSVNELFGPGGLTQVVENRAARQKLEYAKRIPASATLKEKLVQLASIRSEEGYMAELETEGKQGFLLVENHCPICAAATTCRGFCSTEIALFQSVLGPGVNIERVEHIVSGDRRCAYRVSPSKRDPPPVIKSCR
jgi:predicted ArsR family transcriptional regulator